MSPFQYSVKVRERSQAGEARRVASAAAANLGFSETQRGRVAIIATELATNLAKHTREGELLIQEMNWGAERAMEFLAIDTGPGFADIGKVMADGFSTVGTPGTGLGAIRRLSESFDVFSAPGTGSVFMARVRARDGVVRKSPLDYGIVSVPYPGEIVNGDAWGIEELGNGRYGVFMADGLGHGQYASEAAAAAREVFAKRRMDDPEGIISYAHGALRSTRGAAMAVAVIDAERRSLDYAGVGNIAGAVVSGTGTRRMVSYEGTVGHSVRKVQKFSYAWAPDALLVMHTDGLSAHWDLQQYPGLLARHPAVIAGVLYRDHARKTDDATVLVVREAKQ